jgi:hypothetical protein
VMQPAASKISAAVLPSQPGTGRLYTSAHTWGVGGGGEGTQARQAGKQAAVHQIRIQTWGQEDNTEQTARRAAAYQAKQAATTHPPLTFCVAGTR